MSKLSISANIQLNVSALISISLTFTTILSPSTITRAFSNSQMQVYEGELDKRK